MNKLRAAVFFLIGIALMLLSAAAADRTRRFLATAAWADGVVVATPYGGSHPQISFITAASERVTYSQNGLIFGYQVGQRVQVRYQSGAPHDAQVHSFGASWGFTLCGVFLGLAFIIAGRAQLHAYAKLKSP
jgi:hypothetical protein